ncbi:carbamate kinase [Saccharomonospora xinjiangensis]|nr:Carbamate kinase 1 [Saccharomonospora xinjiangensis]
MIAARGRLSVEAMRILIALGGNAMTAADGQARPEDQRAAITEAAEPIADLVAAGHQVLLTHGNGPQVGNLLVKNELAADVVAPVPLDWCGAQTQATVGMLLMNALDRALSARGLAARTAALVSRTLVDPGDEGMRTFTKPVGRYLTRAEAEKLMAHGQRFVEVPQRGWRRVVASPRPREALDMPAAEALLDAGYVVVCSGGGGIPTVRAEDGTLHGVEAVIDKDLTAALLAEQIAANVLVIATDVESVVTDWGTPKAAPIGRVTSTRLREIAREQGFAAGSMGPKVDAVVQFAERAGGTGIITSLHRLADSVGGTVGTQVVPAATTSASRSA